MQQSPIFTKGYDLLLWIIPASLKLPREQRFVLAKRMQDAAFGFYEAIHAAALSRKPMAHLIKADVHLQHLKVYVRMSRDLHYFSMGQYEHAARMMVECGKLLGGWQKKIAGV